MYLKSHSWVSVFFFLCKTDGYLQLDTAQVSHTRWHSTFPPFTNLFIIRLQIKLRNWFSFLLFLTIFVVVWCLGGLVLHLNEVYLLHTTPASTISAQMYRQFGSFSKQPNAESDAAQEGCKIKAFQQKKKLVWKISIWSQQQRIRQMPFFPPMIR